jgi:hypothetical protein
MSSSVTRFRNEAEGRYLLDDDLALHTQGAMEATVVAEGAAPVEPQRAAWVAPAQDLVEGAILERDRVAAVDPLPVTDWPFWIVIVPGLNLKFEARTRLPPALAASAATPRDTMRMTAPILHRCRALRARI